MEMAREPRQILPNHLTEITIKTFQSRFLLAPSKMVNKIIAGIVGRAQRVHKLRIVSIVVMSNHAHVLVVPDSPEQLEAFCRDVASQISKKVGRDLHDWKDGVSRRRYSSIVVTNEEAAQAERLAYLLSHGPKESLCRHPRHWLGLHCVDELMNGYTQIEGTWVNQKKLYDARREHDRKTRGKRGPKPPRPTAADFMTRESIVLSKLPCWEHLTDDEYTRQIRELVASILKRYESERRGAPQRPVTPTFDNPEHRPARTNSSPRPTCHAASRRERNRFRELRRRFLEHYWAASAMFRRGQLDAIDLFPMPCFLPRIRPQPNAPSLALAPA
jgi:hypothetical protein